MIFFLLSQVYEDVNTGQHKRGGYIAQESYENTDQLRHGQSQSQGQPIYPPLSEPGNVTDYKKTSADNPFRCKSSLSYVRDEPEPFTNNKNPTAAESFRSLLVGPGQGQGQGGDLLKKLEDAISRGDHK